MNDVSDPHQLDLSSWIAAANILLADLDRCNLELGRSIEQSGAIDQFWARASVRALFAHLEGTTFEMRRALQEAYDRGAFQLSLAEQAILAERSFELDEVGRPQERPKFLEISKNVRFVFRLFAKAADSDFQLDVSGDGWRCFMSTISVRNRITHPRNPAALDLSTAEVKAAMQTNSWFATQVKRLLETVPRQPTVRRTSDAHVGKS